MEQHAASLADPFTRPVQPDLVLTTFPVIMDSFDLMVTPPIQPNHVCAVYGMGSRVRCEPRSISGSQNRA